MMVVLLFFFFQAEDGIRDLYVTGVQTCALPIFTERPGKKASFFFTAQQRNINDVSVVDAQVLGPGNVIEPFNATVSNPAKRLNISPRVDFQLTPNNTLTVRYQYARNTQSNEGIGEFSL